MHTRENENEMPTGTYPERSPQESLLCQLRALVAEHFVEADAAADLDPAADDVGIVEGGGHFVD